MTVRGELRVRLDGLFATRGRVTMTPEVKRFRGRPTEKPFGDGALRMHRVSGDGALLYRTGGPPLHRRSTSGRDAALLPRGGGLRVRGGDRLRERARAVVDLRATSHLVHLRGRGRFLLAHRRRAGDGRRAARRRRSSSPSRRSSAGSARLTPRVVRARWRTADAPARRWRWSSPARGASSPTPTRGGGLRPLGRSLRKDFLNAPNAITLVRIAMIPVFLVLHLRTSRG